MYLIQAFDCLSIKNEIQKSDEYYSNHLSIQHSITYLRENKDRKKNEICV